MTGEATLEDLEEELDVAGVSWTVDDGEGAGAEGGDELAGVVALGSCALDDDGGRRAVEAREELEQARARLVERRRGGCLVEGEAEIDDGDVDGVGAEDGGGLTPRLGPEGPDAHGLEEAGEAVGPGVGLPAGIGEQEVEAARARAGRGVGRGGAIWARKLHHSGRGKCGAGRAG
jgi:hypothetical protein